MEDEKVLDLIQLAENETDNFQNFDSCTLGGWIRKYDEQKRIINADPNIQESIFKFEDNYAKVRRKGWNINIYIKSKYSFDEKNVSMSNEGWKEIANLDLTPSYL